MYFAKFNINLIIRFLYLGVCVYYYYLEGKGRQQLLIEPIVTNLNKQITVYTITGLHDYRFTQLQMLYELV